MEFFLVQSLNGISYGLLLFMLSSGLTLVFSLMGVLNFAHASFYMLGAYLAYQVSVKIGFWPALVFAPLLVGAVGMLVERWGLRQVHRHGHVAELLFTFGLAYLIEEAVHLIWGRSAVEYRVPAELDGPLFQIMGSQYKVGTRCHGNGVLRIVRYANEGRPRGLFGAAHNVQLHRGLAQ